MHEGLKKRHDADDEPDAAYNSPFIRRIQKILSIPAPKFAIQNSTAELAE